jgi:asparagine synthase (glutamine-hydrolysing)
MCGIAGFIDQQRSRENAEHLIDAMCKVIRHRGPDDQGVWADNGVALGMRRLAIIDLAGGQQPIFNEDHSILVVFNGEIYNYQQLQQELRERGHHFQTTSDTEVLVHAYEEYGDDCVLHLRGMFTFAIWDIQRQRLLAARDRFGKKPLNYYWDGQRLIFGSEIKSILEAGVPRAVNSIALDEYLTYQYIPAPHTLFQDIYKLPAAHLLIYENGAIRTKRYWELPFTATCNDDEETAIERTHALLEEAVRIRLMSEVPLGAFLSGGVDSSTVVGLMSQMMSQPVKTFSIGFEEDDFSELAHARQVAQHFGTDHHEFVVRPDLVSVLPQLAWAYDEPFADASMLPTYYVSKLAREHVTVVLTGDGGDEIFGGYTRYEREVAIQRIPQLVRSMLGLGSSLMPEGMRGKKRFNMMRRDLATRYARTFTPFPVGSRAAMYTPEFAALVQQHNSYQWLSDMFQTAPRGDIITQLQYVDVRSYLTDDILVKVDKASMFNSIETRSPLLDQQLAEYVASLQPTIRVRNGVLKSLLKKVAADLLPAEILHRPKQGFGVPIKHWFRGELTGYAHDLLDSPRAQQRGIFQPQFIRNLLQSHAGTTLVNHSDAIWALLCLELWFQAYMDGDTTAEQPSEAYLASTVSNVSQGR